MPQQAAATPEIVTETEDLFISPVEDMIMIYVPAGEFMMGSTDSQIGAAIAQCNQHYSPCNR